MIEQPMASELLRIARSAVRDELLGVRRPPAAGPADQPPASGVFVTLRNNTRLRGCMGTFAPDGTLLQTVDIVARSACRDPRFTSHPVTPQELDDITIEVSVLTPLVPMTDIADLRIGHHGVLVRHGKSSGCFLPHVATQYDWTAEEFIDQCCTAKARLPAGAWRDPDCSVFLFSAEVLAESG